MNIIDNYPVILRHAGGNVGTAFMGPGHPSTPFSGRGAFLTLQVEDAAAEYERFKRSGLGLDIVQQTDPAPGFWDPYIGQQ